jgi:hypothetical protein
MPSDLFHQSTVTVTAATLTGANYVEDKVNIISPNSLLDYQLLIVDLGGLPYGLGVRDIVFCITAFITIRAALKVKDIKLRSLRRRKFDKEE